MSNPPGSPVTFAENFADPPSSFRGKPFWCWNGRLEKDELIRQVHVFKEMGMGGFFMHSRTGLKTEYLGPEWFDCINACADEAERIGLEAWLYDEDRWPSGSAGGLATRNPKYRMKVLRLTVNEAEAFDWPAESRFVAAFVARLDGLSFSESARLEYRSTIPRDGRKVLLFTVETWSGHSFYNGNAYLDTLNADATREFIEITHEQYRRHCGSRLGKSIRGIFTDEPHHGTVMCENNENRAMEDQRWTTPWTEMLWSEFEQAWGYDLREHLPELFLFPDGRRVSPVKWHYMELLQRMFLRNWAQPLHDWCHNHGLQLTGHVLHEDSLTAQAVPCGSVMRYYEYLDIPGVDLLALHNQNYWIVKQATSAARQFGKKEILSELYGCTGWQLDFAGHKRIGAWQALLGVNVRCHHLAWMTMEGEAKRDYPASIHFQSAWHRQYAAVEDYFARLHMILGQGKPVCDVLVVNPIESTWAQIHPGWAQWLGALDSKIEAVECTYRRVFHALLAAHLDFDYGDEDHLARFGQVETTHEGPGLRLGEQRYRVVIVAGMTTIRRSTLRLLSEFVESGGSVIFAGTPPDYVEAIPSEAAWKLASKAIEVPLDEGALAAAVYKESKFSLTFKCARSLKPGQVLSQVRQDGERWIVAIVNTSEHEGADCALALRANGHVEEWNCHSGKRCSVPTHATDGCIEWNASLPPLGEAVFVADATRAEEVPDWKSFVPSGSEEIPGPYAYELEEPNLCVLDFAEFQLNKGPWVEAAEILRQDEAIRHALGMEQRSGVMVQPWAAARQPRPPVPLTLRFRFNVEAIPIGSVALLIENPKAYRIALNGVEIENAANHGWLIDPCFKRFPLPRFVFRPGLNEITLETNFTPETDLEAIYLAGNFGVSLEGPIPSLIRLPSHLAAGDVAAQGLPFYSGRITYRLPVPQSLRNNGNAYRLQIGRYGGAVARVRTSQCGVDSIVAFPPYEAELPGSALKENSELLCDIWLTRRNTFGPLHLLPQEQPHIGPMSFRTKDAEFTEKYVLVPAGLLEPPQLIFGSQR